MRFFRSSSLLVIIGALLGPAQVRADQVEPWHGIWAMDGLECPRLEALQQYDWQGSNWHLFPDRYCDAAAGVPAQGGTWKMIGLCRSFAALNTETWTFEEQGPGEAKAQGPSGASFAMKRCDN